MYFPKTLPDPAKSDELEPIGLSTESDIALDEWLEVSAPIEGENSALPGGSSAQTGAHIVAPNAGSAQTQPQATVSRPDNEPAQAPVDESASVEPQEEESDRPLSQLGTSSDDGHVGGEYKTTEEEEEEEQVPAESSSTPMA